jgi:hypothetical protein
MAARPFVAVEEGDLSCPHNGTRKLSGLAEPTAKLTVDTSPVVPVSVAPGLSEYKDCTLSDSQGKAHPCQTTTVTSAGAARLTVDDRQVLLDSDSLTATNDLLVPSSVSVHPAQSKLTAS